MAKAPKLKVFTAPIGFHDVYVAAPSRAAALRAWGSDHDLFARGIASEVTDPAVTQQPLAKPGVVFRHLRGTEAEQFAALPADAPAHGKERRADGRRAGRPTAREPSRARLEQAEAALKAAEARHREKEREALARVTAAQREHEALKIRNTTEVAELTRARNRAQARFDREHARWLSEQAATRLSDHE